MLSFRPIYRISLMVIALMSGPFSLIREILQFTDPSKYPDRPLFIACLWVAFMVAAALLWWDENQGKRKAEKALNDNRPKLCFRHNGFAGRKAWAENPYPVAFTIQHISGRVPTSIHFSPISSKQGKFSLQFSALPCADPSPHQSGMGFEIVEVDAPKLSAKDWEATQAYQKDMLLLFLDDSPADLANAEYPFTARFVDCDEQRSQSFSLVFDRDRFRFSEDTSSYE